MASYADNIQLLRRSAEDVKHDARQWAALSGDPDPRPTRSNQVWPKGKKVERQCTGLTTSAARSCGSRPNKTITTSTAEAELLSLSHTARETIGLYRLFETDTV
jgi:hypothetical protein